MAEDEIDTNLEEKQKYLREEIIDKKYDVEEFSEFMNQYKENGLDLKNWTFSELKEAVKIFIKGRKEPNKEDEQKKIEKGIKNIRKSYNLSIIEYPNMDQVNNNSENNNNIKINYNYDVINYNNLQDYNGNEQRDNQKHQGINNNINNIKTNDIDINNNNNTNQYPESFSNNSSIINEDCNINKKHEINNTQEVNNEQNGIKTDNNTNNNESKTENQDNDYPEFEIIDDTSFIKKEPKYEAIKCVKQSENILTKKDNLNVVLEK